MKIFLFRIVDAQERNKRTREHPIQAKKKSIYSHMEMKDEDIRAVGWGGQKKKLSFDDAFVIKTKKSTYENTFY